MRLMSSNAIYSARESLLVMFDEIRKKYEETELKTSPLHQHSPRHNNSSTSKWMRKELWIHVESTLYDDYIVLPSLNTTQTQQYQLQRPGLGSKPLWSK
ncbi:uncharacterized protein [Eurosta solidaginis]|uniref:uncharacterized protein isoform X2 n=1 Tax=Eurosta solidaginis TaxID=178769 RepID=UPI003530881E